MASTNPPPEAAAAAANEAARQTSLDGSHGNQVGAAAGADADLNGSISKDGEQQIDGNEECKDGKLNGGGSGGDKSGCDGGAKSILEGGGTDKGKQTGGKQSDGKQPHHNKPRAEPRAATGISPPQIQTITITAADVASTVASVVDPWVPRLRNNDEYLQRGLDFAPKAKAVLSRGVSENGDDENDEKGNENKSESASVEGNGDENSKEDAAKNGSSNPRQSTHLVGDIGATRLAEALVPNTHLLSLNLSRNDIGSEGGIALAKCLYALNPDPEIGFESKTALRVVNLAHNKIGDEGALAFALALRYNSSLRELRLGDNGMGAEGVIQLVGGLEHNDNIKRLGLGDNVRQMSSGERERLVECVAKVCEKGRAAVPWRNDTGGSALEVLEMHCTDDARGRWERDNFDGLSKDDLSTLQLAMWKNTRLRTLTVPSTAENNERDKEHKRLICQLRKAFRFNSFYRPIHQLHDVQHSPLAVAESSLGLPVKLPGHLKRDDHSGALIGLLPTASKTKSTRSSSSTGVEYKLLPKVLGFACNECSLDAVWNVVRYRPDMFCCVGETVSVECAPCGSLGEGCIVS